MARQGERRARRDDALGDALSAVRYAYSEPEMAAQLAETALARDPNDDETRAVATRALGMAAAAQGDLASSVRLLRQAVRTAERADVLERAAEARGSLAYVLVLRGRGGAALRELDQAEAVLTSGTSAARLRMQRGLVLGELRRVDEARIALKQALVILDRAGGDDLVEADIRNNLAIIETARLDWRHTDEELDLAEELYERTGLTGRTAMVWHNRATALSLRGEVPAALAAFDRAARLYHEAGLFPGLLSVERAEALLSAGLVAEARDEAAHSVAAFRGQGNRVDLVQARVILAESALLDGDPGVARAQGAAARRDATAQDRPGWAALAAFVELRAREAEGARPGRLIEQGRAVSSALAEAGWLPQSMDATLLVARNAVRAGRREDARAALDAVRGARRGGTAAVRVHAWHAEALHRAAADDRRGAAIAVSAGLRLVDDFRETLGATELRTHVSLLAAPLADLAVGLALETGRPERVLAAAESSRAAALWLRPARPADDEGVADQLSQMRRLDAELRAGEISPQSARTRQVALERVVRDLTRHVGGAGDGVGRGRERGGHASKAARPAIAALQAELGNAALIEFVNHDRELHAVVVTPASARVLPLGGVATVAAPVEALRAGLQWLTVPMPSDQTASAGSALVERAAMSLDAALLRPLLGELDGGPLVLVPSGALAGLPWSALPSLASRAFSVAPSAALWLRAIRTRQDRDASERRHPRTPRHVLASGPGLPGAVREVRTIAATYPGSVTLTGDQATVAAVLGAIDGADLAHLAAHGRFRADSPMFSSLTFADGPMTIHDLEGLAVAPGRMVLAACDTGLASVHPGDEVIGLATALLALGTTSLVAPVVPVPDEASRRFGARFHRRLRAGMSPGAALAAARQAGLRSGKPADVVTAAGFTCLGAG